MNYSNFEFFAEDDGSEEKKIDCNAENINESVDGNGKKQFHLCNSLENLVGVSEKMKQIMLKTCENDAPTYKTCTKSCNIALGLCPNELYTDNGITFKLEEDLQISEPSNICIDEQRCKKIAYDVFKTSYIGGDIYALNCRDSDKSCLRNTSPPGCTLQVNNMTNKILGVHFNTNIENKNISGDYYSYGSRFLQISNCELVEKYKGLAGTDITIPSKASTLESTEPEKVDDDSTANQKTNPKIFSLNKDFKLEPYIVVTYDYVKDGNYFISDKEKRTVYIKNKGDDKVVCETEVKKYPGWPLIEYSDKIAVNKDIKGRITPKKGEDGKEYILINGCTAYTYENDKDDNPTGVSKDWKILQYCGDTECPKTTFSYEKEADVVEEENPCNDICEKKGCYDEQDMAKEECISCFNCLIDNGILSEDDIKIGEEVIDDLLEDIDTGNIDKDKFLKYLSKYQYSLKCNSLVMNNFSKNVNYLNTKYNEQICVNGFIVDENNNDNRINIPENILNVFGKVKENYINKFYKNNKYSGYKEKARIQKILNSKRMTGLSKKICCNKKLLDDTPLEDYTKKIVKLVIKSKKKKVKEPDSEAIEKLQDLIYQSLIKIPNLKKYKKDLLVIVKYKKIENFSEDIFTQDFDIEITSLSNNKQINENIEKSVKENFNENSVIELFTTIDNNCKTNTDEILCGTIPNREELPSEPIDNILEISEYTYGCGESIVLIKINNPTQPTAQIKVPVYINKDCTKSVSGAEYVKLTVNSVADLEDRIKSTLSDISNRFNVNDNFLTFDECFVYVNMNDKSYIPTKVNNDFKILLSNGKTSDKFPCNYCGRFIETIEVPERASNEECRKYILDDKGKPTCAKDGCDVKNKDRDCKLDFKKICQHKDSREIDIFSYGICQPLEYENGNRPKDFPTGTDTLHPQRNSFLKKTLYEGSDKTGDKTCPKCVISGAEDNEKVPSDSGYRCNHIWTINTYLGKCDPNKKNVTYDFVVNYSKNSDSKICIEDVEEVTITHGNDYTRRFTKNGKDEQDWLDPYLIYKYLENFRSGTLVAPITQYNSSENNLSIGAIVGIVAGSIVTLTVIVVIYLRFFRKK